MVNIKYVTQILDNLVFSYIGNNEYGGLRKVDWPKDNVFRVDYHHAFGINHISLLVDLENKKAQVGDCEMVSLDEGVNLFLEQIRTIPKTIKENFAKDIASDMKIACRGRVVSIQ